MALINCPECGKQISDKAPACPNCGYPLDLYRKEKEAEEQELAQQKKEEEIRILSASTIESATEDAMLSVKEDVSDFDINYRRKVRIFKVDAAQYPWICAGCKAVIYDTSGSLIGGRNGNGESSTFLRLTMAFGLHSQRIAPFTNTKFPKFACSPLPTQRFILQKNGKNLPPLSGVNLLLPVRPGKKKTHPLPPMIHPALTAVPPQFRQSKKGLALGKQSPAVFFLALLVFWAVPLAAMRFSVSASTAEESFNHV